MKNDKIVNAFNSIQPGKEVENRVFNKITHKKSIVGQNIMSKKIIAIAGATAVLAICLFASNFLDIFNINKGTNSFSMVAYAADGGEIASSGEGVEFCMITDPGTLERLKVAQFRTVEINFIGDTIKSVDLETPMIKMTLFCFDDDGNPLVDMDDKTLKTGYPEELTEDFMITAIAHFLDGTTETKTITIPAELCIYENLEEVTK
jgi:hypothetical protein